jgi:Cu/Ag efflux protein CusF
MKLIRNGLGSICLALLVTLGACATKSNQPPPKQYELHGQIMGLDPDGHVATVKHGAIPGFMGAMTMGYPIKDQSEFSKLKVGEPITATVYVSGDDMWLGNIHEAEKQP